MLNAAAELEFVDGADVAVGVSDPSLSKYRVGHYR